MVDNIEREAKLEAEFQRRLRTTNTLAGAGARISDAMREFQDALAVSGPSLLRKFFQRKSDPAWRKYP